jgi:hypothetical protein
MNDAFEITVPYRDNNLQLPVEFIQSGYSYRFRVTLPNGTGVIFEPDEERALRAIAVEGTDNPHHTDPALLETIARTIDHLLR